MQMFNDPGLRGLYGNNYRSTKARMWLDLSEFEILGSINHAELAANLFRATQAEDKLRREQTKGKLRANQVHFDVGKRVRQTIHELGGTMPESLPVAENIEKVAKRLKKAAMAELSSGNSDPDE